MGEDIRARGVKVPFDTERRSYRPAALASLKTATRLSARDQGLVIS